MQRTKPGHVTERITLLGTRESCLYLVDGGEESMMIGGGMAYIAPDVLSQLRDFSVDEKKIRRIVILHSHFDHCGLVPFIKKKWPWIIVTASRRARELLLDARVSDSIGTLNRKALARAGLEEKAREMGFEFTSIRVEEVLREGDRVRCGELSLEVLEVPGHSSCSIALYMPEEKALFASDAAGVRCGDYYMAVGNSNFDLFQQSLEKMSGLEVQILLGEHFGALDGEEGRDYLKKAIEEAGRTRGLLEESYRRTGNVDASTEEVTKILLEKAPKDFLTREALKLVAGQMVRFIARRSQSSDGEESGRLRPYAKGNSN
jgi:glyoxylase-like metal-dependent hydrolase (beta-lactamase superfamily II)